MKVLFIGGTGNISTSCSRAAVRLGIDLYHLNRGSTLKEPMDGVTTITADIRDPLAAKSALEGYTFDCVVNWIAFEPAHIETDLALFRGRTAQYIFISSASVYHKPPSHYVITESTPAYNPFWNYSQRKIACERKLVDEYESSGFPFTIVRPSHTYGEGWFPTTFGSRDFTVPQRILDGRRIVVHGDGQSLWTLTHSDDFAEGFVGLLGNPGAVGETFHITSDEALTWDHIHKTIGRVLGREPIITHVDSQTIASISERFGPGLLGDKRYSLVFDNSKIKRLVPGFSARIPFHRGIERSYEWVQTAPDRKLIDGEMDKIIDRLLEYHQ
jgi:nucleoside-diphosphate-sugar epimerase